MLSTVTGIGQWSPLRLPGLVAWFNANRNNVIINATSEVLTWNGTSGTSLATTGTDEPDWGANTWGQRVGGIAMAQTSATAMSSSDAAIVNAGSGTDTPFSLFCTIRPTLVADHTIACWQDTVGNSLSSLRMNNSGGGTLRYRRTDAAASNVDVDGAASLGFTSHTVCVLFSGTSVEIYLDGALDGSGSSNVGALTPDVFKLGSGPGIDAFTGIVADLAITNRLVSIPDAMAYAAWSRKVLGV